MDAQDTPDAAERRARARVAARGHDIVTTGHVIEWPASGCARMTERETRTHIPGEPDEADRDVLSLADALRAAEARAVAAEASLRSTGDSALRITTQLGAALIERDAADARHAALAAAVREYRGAVDDACIAKGSEDAGLDAAFAAAEREDDAARAVDALLRGAPGGYVPVRVVASYKAAVERIADLDDDSPESVAAFRAARIALDAALAAATTTPTEGHRP